MSSIDFTQVVTAEAKAEAKRAALYANLANIRWERETGGITLPDGSRISTDEVSARKLTSAVTSLDKGMVSEPLNFKFNSGWQQVTKAQVEAAAAAVSRHVQSCFDAEMAVSAQIEALTDAEVAAFDVRAAFDAAMGVA